MKKLSTQDLDIKLQNACENLVPDNWGDEEQGMHHRKIILDKLALRYWPDPWIDNSSVDTPENFLPLDSRFSNFPFSHNPFSNQLSGNGQTTKATRILFPKELTDNGQSPSFRQANRALGYNQLAVVPVGFEINPSSFSLSSLYKRFLLKQNATINGYGGPQGPQKLVYKYDLNYRACVELGNIANQLGSASVNFFLVDECSENLRYQLLGSGYHPKNSSKMTDPTYGELTMYQKSSF